LPLLRAASNSVQRAGAAMLEPALATGLLRQADVGKYVFAHALVRETIYRDIPAGTRADLHRQVAEALERIHQGTEDLVLSQLAFHFLEAVPQVGAAKCIEYSVRAADLSQRLFAFEHAAGHYATAI